MLVEVGFVFNLKGLSLISNYAHLNCNYIYKLEYIVQQW